MVALALVATRDERGHCRTVAPPLKDPPPEPVREGIARLPAPHFGQSLFAAAPATVRHVAHHHHLHAQRKHRHPKRRKKRKRLSHVQQVMAYLHHADPLGMALPPAPSLAARSFKAGKARLVGARLGNKLLTPAADASPNAAPVTAQALPQPAFGAPPAQPKALATPPVASGPDLPKPAFGQGAKPPLAASASCGEPKFTPDDELIFQIETQRHEREDTVVGYQFRGQTYLPLAEIARFLDLAITVSDGGHYASGWVLDPKHTLALNLRDHTVTVDGVTRKLESCDAAAYDGELFLNANRFADLLPLSLGVSLRNQSITVKTRQPFPFEERAAREEAREHLAARRMGDRDKRWPREATPWLPFSFPLGDLETRAVSDSTYGTRVENDLRLAGDLAWLTSRLFVSTSTRYGVTAAHMEMGRRDSAGTLLGPMKATDFRFGDVSTTPMPIGLGAATGRGAMVTNAPLEHASVFDTIDFKGDLPTGYEVELYRNGLLIDSTRQATNGQYQFMRVGVDFGLNLFRLVFYGPQGQRREVIRQVSVGDGRLAKGQFTYALGAVQKNVNLLDINPPNFLPGQDYGAWRGVAQVQYGLTSGLTLAASTAAYQSLGRNRWLATAGLRTGLGGVALKLDAALADHGGRAVEANVGGRLAGFSYKLAHAEYGGLFTDEVRAYTADPLRRASEISVNGAIRLGRGLHPLVIPTYAFARAISFADGRALTSVTLQQSVQPLAGVMASNTLAYSRTTSSFGTGTSALIGSFDLSTMRGSRTNYRGTLGYALNGAPEITVASAEINHRISDAFMLRAGVGHYLSAGQTSFGASAVRRFDRFTLAVDGNYLTGSGQYSAMLRLSFGFGRNPFNQRLFMAPPGLSNGGAAAIRAYRDTNGNGVYDEGESTLSGVTFNTGIEHATTDKDGTAFLGRLGDGMRTNFQVDADALPDVSLAPVTRGVDIAPRAGRIHKSDFAIIALSDIDGTAYFLTEGKEKAVSGLQILLIDAQGKRVGRARTSSDGSFWFEQVRGGEYTLLLDPAQSASLAIRMVGEARIKVGSDGRMLRQILRVESSQSIPSAIPPR